MASIGLEVEAGALQPYTGGSSSGGDASATAVSLRTPAPRPRAALLCASGVRSRLPAPRPGR